ncbi:MAG TPA: C25 family cysteine peptidase [Candidatus Sulfotelmatobacter sp.]
MTDRGADSKLFDQVTRELLEQGMDVLFQARGASMSPAIRDGEIVQVTPVIVSKLRKDDIVLTKSKNGFRLHRVVVADPENDVFVTRGDCGEEDDPAVSGEKIVGIAVAKEVRVGRRIFRAKFHGAVGLALRCAARGQRMLQNVFGRTGETEHRARVTFTVVLGVLLILLAATNSSAQVAVDATTTGTIDAAGTGVVPLTFAHTTTATANRLLLVGVSISVTNSTGATVSSVTYNGTALTRQGFQNDAAPTRRVEIWSLLAPASGAATIVVNVNVPTNNTVGVVAGATTFTDVDQTVPLGTFVSASGEVAGCVASASPTSACSSQINVPSVVNGMVFDTFATGIAPTVTEYNPQVQQWNLTSGGGNNRDVTGSSSTRSGAPSVPVSELLNSTSNWAQGGISINPSAADIGVTTSVASAVFVGQNTTYTTTVFNNGPSPANTGMLTLSWPTSMAVVSITPSAGTTCTAAPPPITCTLPTPFTSAMTGTVTVVATASTSGVYTETATVTDSGTPPDTNPSNNTYVAAATVQAVACAPSSTAAPGNGLTGVLNTYYPGTASVAAGATSIPVGTPTGAGTAIAAGDLLLVIQMQDASLNLSNSVTYGNGFTGQGFTALNSTGDYEFVTANGAISGGSVSITGAGSGNGLVFPYHAAAASATAGQSTYQVIVVPQYTTASFNAATPPTALAWNGSTGGVLAIDTSAALNLNGATVVVDGMGFRGGAGMQLTGGGTGTGADFLYPAPATYTGAGEAGVDGPKGEGIAGTPAWVEFNRTYLATGTGYPNVTAGTDGSMGRGAPGNAGGGGTDPDQGGNSQNAGGGGGGNGGAGGFGGNSWASNQSTGGEGGVAFPATINRIAMGGGGGAGDRNNSNGDNQASGAAAGGGIIIIRAYALTGAATLTANGASAYNGTANDAGGGGGAGGTIVVLSANGGEGGLTLQANGGNGGDAWISETFTLGNRHGPGGGGGGGVILVSGTPASASKAGGTNGLTEVPSVSYGSTPGGAGFTVTNASISSTSGTLSGAQCTPDMTLGKSHVGNFVRGLTASYSMPVSNVSPYGATNGLVTINDTLPLGVIPTVATGTGWACAVAAQTVSCMRSDVLPGASSYPTITVNANVSQSAPSTVTNTAMVGGGGEINLANDSATDVATVVSSADLSVTNVASPNPVTSPGTIIYTQLVTNNGPSAADNATLVDPVPANTLLQSITPPAGWSCVTPGGPGNIVCTNSNMAGSTSGTFTLVMKVNSGVANGTVITQTASVSSAVSDPNVANNTATANTVVGTTAQGELTVTNVASPNPVAAGSDITYTQVVTNTGAAAATTATFNETTPTNTSFVLITPPAGWNCTGFPPQCTNPSVAAGATGTFMVLYKVTAGTANGTTISDTVTVNAANQAFGANAAVATDVVAGAAQADLVLTTAATPGYVISGNNITYTQTVTNNGPAAATAASFTEATPTNTTFQSVSAPAGWTCTAPAVGATGNVNCTNPSMAAGTAADIVVEVNVAPAIAAGTITATSSVTATNAVNTSATTTTTPVVTVCDLTVTSSVAPNPATAGGTVTYTQTVTNHGPSNCSTAKFNEATPANTTFASVAAVTTGGGTWTCPNVGPVACTNPSVPPGSTVTITAKYNVNGGTGGLTISDTATASSTTKDSNPADNTVTVVIGIAGAAQADLSMTDSASANPVTAGNNFTFTQTVKNLGPATAGSNTANTITMTGTLTGGATALTLTGPAGWTCAVGTLTCMNNANTTLASGASVSFTLTVMVPAGTPNGTTITDSVSVSETTPTDPNSNNNSASASVQVGDSADLQVTDSASPVPAVLPTNVVYTQIVTNAGPSAATSVTLTDTLPANTTVVSLTGPGGWTCTTATGICTNPSFAVGSATFTYTVTVNAGTPAGTVINSTATVTSATPDPNPANNTATAKDVVASAGQADLSMANTPSVSTIAAGGNVTYTQVITNLGPAATTAGTATLTQTVPANMTFQSMTPPAGWTCPPPVGGTITCTANAGTSIALNGTASFSLVMQVVATTPSGTNIPDTATASAGNVVPNLTTNSATATVLVANANSADMAIVKTATPNPVSQGDTITYTLAVTNNGPASATNVTVVDTLPTEVTYLSVTTTAGTCSEAGGTVTCLLGTMANGGTATVTVLTIAGVPGVVSNTATVSADQTDPNPVNNSSTQTETITAATSIQLQSFAARVSTDKDGSNRVLLMWKTGGEANNLGFNVYREVDGNRVRLNPSLIAGSALWMSGALPKHAGKTYNWIDPSSQADANGAGAAYWLEDVDVNGTRTMHGPVLAEDAAYTSSGAHAAAESTAVRTLMLSELNQSQPGAGTGSHPVETLPGAFSPTTRQTQTQFYLAAHPAVKILVRHEGWYSVAQPDLVNAGLDPNVDPVSLQLFAEAIEQPIRIVGATSGPGGFGPQASISFYGTGIDTQYSGTRVYWLVVGRGSGTRIPQMQASSGANVPAPSFSYTVEVQPRTIYFAALITSDGDNFFGPLVSTTPVEQVMQTPNLDASSSRAATLDVTLQGVIKGIPHQVSVALNGTALGEVNFTGQQKGMLHVSVPPGVLQEGHNTVTLTAQNGEYDTSLVSDIRITYPHLYAADSDLLKFTGRAGDEVTVGGFANGTITVLDITDPAQPVQVSPQITNSNGTYAFAAQVPWTTTASGRPARHTLLAVAADQVAAVAGAQANHPSTWHSAQPGAEVVMVSHEDFVGALPALVAAHQASGKSSVIVPVGDLYDEFNFGERSPYAIRQFLQMASHDWQIKPKYLQLNGRASVDPRNYLGFGYLDFVPTKIVASTELMTASDDWFSDFHDTGMPTIATGRLPVSTLDEANTVVGKIAAYEGQSTNGPWTAEALVVADRDDTINFTQDSQKVQSEMPSALQVTDVFASAVGDSAARQQIVSAINSGQLLVNYVGHGSEDQWSGQDIFDNNTVAALTNGSQLPVFFIMDCLNGFFQDVYDQPLAVTLLLARNGGGVAVLASSGLNQAPPQAQLDAQVVKRALSASQPTLGDAIMAAKSQIGAVVVRKTYILFGDPAMQMKQPGVGAASN